MAKENYLYQLPIPEEIIQQWRPLNTLCVNPLNCGPTALALSGAVPREIAQQEGYISENTGIIVEQMTDYMRTYLDRYKIEQFFNDKLSIDELMQGIKDELLPNHITMFAFHRPVGEIGHVTLIMKTIDNRLFLLDGQTKSDYFGEAAIRKYIRDNRFISFSYWLMNNENKRRMMDDDNILRKPKQQERNLKRIKVRGGKNKKTNKKRNTNKKY